MDAGRRLRLIASDQGRHAALIEPGRIVVVQLPALEVSVELELDVPDLDGVGLLPDGRLVMVTAGQLVVHDGAEWTPVAGYGRQPGSQLVATHGGLVLTSTGVGASVTDLGEATPKTRRIPIRGPVRQATVLADGRFAFVLEDALEVWNLEALAPARRIRVRPAGRLQIGGVSSQVWCVHAERPRWIDVLPATRSAYRVGVGEDLGIARGSPDGMHVAIVRALTGRAGVVALHRDPLAIDEDSALVVSGLDAEPPVEDVAWVGDAVLTCNGERVLQLLRPGEPASADRPPMVSASATVAPASSPAMIPPSSPAIVPPSPPAIVPRSSPVIVPPPARAAAASADDEDDDASPPPEHRVSAHERLLAWRQRIGAERAAAEGQPTETYDPQEATRAYDDWRRELVSAVRRRIVAGGGAHIDVPAIIGDVARRLDVSGEILALAYGAFLAGIDGVPPVEIARIDGVEWSEALGGGRLAALGALVWSRSRVRLARELRAIFDERPPLSGTIVRGPAVTRTVAIVGDAADLDAVAARLVGPAAVLVPGPGGRRWPRRLLLEATARDAAPLLPWTEAAPRLGVPPARAILVVDDASIAGALGVALLSG